MDAAAALQVPGLFPAHSQDALAGFCTGATQSAQSFVAGFAASLGGAPTEIGRSLLELSFRRALLDLAGEASPSAAIQRLLLLSLALAEQGWADPALPLGLLEDLFDVWPLERSAFVLDFMESEAERLAAGASSSRGKGLVLLRMSNELNRRLSKTGQAARAGRVLLFLSKAFPASERSGLNLRGDLNLEPDMASRLDPPEGARAEEHSVDEVVASLSDRRTPISYGFYRRFWTLQHHFCHPIQSLLTENWGAVTRSVDDTLDVFKASPPGSQTAPRAQRYLVSRRLLKLELADATFRRQFLLQLLIYLQHLQAYGSRTELRPPAAKSVADSLLSPAQEAWIDSCTRRVYDTVGRAQDGPAAAQSLQHLLASECHWIGWKSQSCPSLEKPTVVLDGAPARVPLSRVPTPPGGSDLGTPELARLWKEHSLDRVWDGLKERESTPDLPAFLAPLREQLDAENQIEREYRLSADPDFAWKAHRLVRQKRPDLVPVLAAVGLEGLVARLFQDETGADSGASTPSPPSPPPPLSTEPTPSEAPESAPASPAAHS